MLSMAGLRFIRLQVYVACGYELTAAIAFPSLAYFQLLRFPLVMLPSTIQNCVNGLIALRRMQSFLEVGCCGHTI